MWAVFIFIMGIIGIVLINIFGNITTTNQQDYTLMKNITEAAMHDAIDYASYKSGFYLCITNSGLTKDKTTGVYQFNSTNDYKIVRNRSGVELDLKDVSDDKMCDFLQGEYIINRDVFVESLLRRFSENINNNKSYEITIQNVIEYPPKVSVRIDTYNTYNSSQSNDPNFNKGDFQIRNQIDAILEEK